MELSSIPTPPTRIGELMTAYQVLPKEFSMLDETKANDCAHADLAKFTTEASTLRQLNQDCSLSRLFVEDDHATIEGILNVTPRRSTELMELKTLTYLSKEQSCVKGERKKWRRVQKPAIDLSFKNVIDESPDATEILNDIFVTVYIYKPLPLVTVYVQSQDHYLVPTQRLVVLGSQKLSDLKDAIKCPQDKIWLGDCSDALDDPDLHIPAENLYKSSYFFIENTFFDDMRDPQNHRLSQPVLQWLKTKSEFDSSGPFSSVLMEDVLLRDVVMCLGRPYHFVHQGNCDHIICFSDVNLVDRDACQSRSLFPMLTGRNHVRAVRCAACKRLPCRWLTFNAGLLLPKDPCPLCNVCLRLVCYDGKGNKIKPEIRVHMYCGDEVVVYG